jgi:dihydropteroate synthase
MDISRDNFTETLIFFFVLKTPELTAKYKPIYFSSDTLKKLFEAIQPHVLQYKEEPGARAQVAARHQVPVIVMHNQEGTDYSRYDGDVVAAEREFFRRTVELAERAGLPREMLIFDPGVGFGKTVADNLMVMNRQEELLELDGCRYPLLLGTSRKSVIGRTLDLPVEERLEGTLATSAIGTLKGADIIRVHDVKENLRAVRMAEAIANG